MNIKFYALPLMSLALTLLGSSLGAQQGATGQEDADLKAKEQQVLSENANAAAAWLKLVDEGNYAASWESASLQFKTTVTDRAEWVKMLEKWRKPLGRVVSRTLLQQLPKENPKDLAKGYYMVLVFQTEFSNRPKANELLTMYYEDGQWRVLTYQAV